MSVYEQSFEEVAAQVQQLSPKDQLRLITHLAAHLMAVVPPLQNQPWLQEQTGAWQISITTPTGSFGQPLRSVVDILAEAPGQRFFKTGEDVETYLAAERAAWDK